MRLSAFILNMLMLVMILVPCRDHDDHVRTAGANPQFYAATQDHGQTDDICSPLCTCSCCASVSPMVHKPVVGAFIAAQGARKFPAYFAAEYAAERSAIWQPPRIG